MRFKLTIRTIAFAAAAAAVLLPGCSDFLDVPPVNAPIVSTFYQTEDDLELAVNAAYSSLANTSLYKWGMHLQREVISDDVGTPEAGLQDAANFNFKADNADIGGMWNSLYQGIFRANLVIANYNDVKKSSRRDEIYGEALFIRAFCYWHLVTIWNRAPLITEAREGAYSDSSADATALYAQIATDLTTAISLLPSSPENGRAGKAAAQALLGKALLQQKRYTEAAAMFQAVITGATNSLDSIDKVWTVSGEYGSENLFEISFHKSGDNPFYDDGGDDATGGMRNVFLGPAQSGGWQNLYPSASMVAEFEPGDRRIKAFMYTIGDTLPDGKIYAAAENKNDYAIRKGITSAVSSFWPGGFDENTPVIRYADVLLMLAECDAMTAKDAAALALVDQVRARAGLGDAATLIAANPGWTTMDAVKHERRVELCFEMHRYVDLVRWGDEAAKLGTRFKAEHRYWPIPQSDIDNSGGALVQNSGY